MSEMVHALESRRMLSATIPPALLSTIMQLESDAAAMKTSLLHDQPTINADAAALNAAFHDLPKSTQNRALLTALHKHELGALVTLKKDLTVMMKVGAAAIGKTLTDAMQASLHPSATAQAKLSADVTALQAVATPLFTAFATDVQTIGATITADLAAIVSANPNVPAVQNAVTKIHSDFATAFPALQTHFQAIEADFQNLLSGLKAMA